MNGHVNRGQYDLLDTVIPWSDLSLDYHGSELAHQNAFLDLTHIFRLHTVRKILVLDILGWDSSRSLFPSDDKRA